MRIEGFDYIASDEEDEVHGEESAPNTAHREHRMSELPGDSREKIKLSEPQEEVKMGGPFDQSAFEESEIGEEMDLMGIGAEDKANVPKQLPLDRRPSHLLLGTSLGNAREDEEKINSIQ